MYIYKYPTGQIIAVEEEIPEDQLFDLEFVEQRDCDQIFAHRHFWIDGKIVEQLPNYREQRAMHYPGLTDQLDSLWHAVDQGLFGDAAKFSTFYQDILSVKAEFPKTDK